MFHSHLLSASSLPSAGSTHNLVRSLKMAWEGCRRSFVASAAASWGFVRQKTAATDVKTGAAEGNFVIKILERLRGQILHPQFSPDGIRIGGAVQDEQVHGLSGQSADHPAANRLLRGGAPLLRQEARHCGVALA